MEIEKFSKKTGKIIQVGTYFVFEPNHLPMKIDYDEKMVSLLAKTILNLGNLNGIGSRMDNPNLLIIPYLKKEAVLSSKIEGTKTTLSEVFISEKEKEKGNKDDDLEEVKNYIKAMSYGLQKIKDEKITEELIMKLHEILMNGVRGKNKEPGKYKTVQNWIGTSYDIHEAKFVPATPESIPFLIKNLVEYINKENDTSPLIKSAIIHYQFETVHPFRDGNGRLGRLLIMLYLLKEKILELPLIYLSAFFEKYKDDYTNRLFNVSYSGEVNKWLTFFLDGINTQTTDSLKKVKELEKYKSEIYEILRTNTKSNNVLRLVDFLFMNPYITVKEVLENLNLNSMSSGKNLIDLLVKNGIIVEISGKERNKIYLARKIIEILESD